MVINPEIAKEIIDKKIVFLNKENKTSNIDTLKQNYGDDIVVTDFYINNSENGEPKDFGVIYKNVPIIDHHMNLSIAQDFLSSTNFAINYINSSDLKNRDYKIVINHTDCDSSLSALILSKIISPDKKYWDAAISADHTGEENIIADLLQSIKDKNSLIYSYTQLYNLLNSKELDEYATKSLENRINNRKIAKNSINKIKLFSNNIAYIENSNIDIILYLQYLPENIKIFCDVSKDTIKIRFTKNINKQISLKNIPIHNLSCRWDAGSVKNFSKYYSNFSEVLKILDKAIS